MSKRRTARLADAAGHGDQAGARHSHHRGPASDRDRRAEARGRAGRRARGRVEDLEACAHGRFEIVLARLDHSEVNEKPALEATGHPPPVLDADAGPARLEGADQLAILARLDAARTGRSRRAEPPAGAARPRTHLFAPRFAEKPSQAVRDCKRRWRSRCRVAGPGAAGSKPRDGRRFPAASATAAREPSSGVFSQHRSLGRLEDRSTGLRARTARHPSSRDLTARSARPADRALPVPCTRACRAARCRRRRCSPTGAARRRRSR